MVKADVFVQREHSSFCCASCDQHTQMQRPKHRENPEISYNLFRLRLSHCSKDNKLDFS